MTCVLHDFALDDHCYKVRLLLSVLRIDHAVVPVDVLPGRRQETPAYRRLDPRGRLPILTDGDLVLGGAEAILAYLAKAYDPTRQWLPEEPKAFGLVLHWLGFATCDLACASQARAHDVFEAPGDGAVLRRAARAALRLMDDHMTRRHFVDAAWFAAGSPTIADLALFPAFALSRDYGIDHDEFPALRRWARRVRALAGFVTMPGIPDYH